MTYLVTARKWRPRKFDEVVAQEHITTTLKNAVASGRIAQCYLFCGPRGVGKTTTARILAKVLNCPNRSGSDPCDECNSCRSIAEGTSMNVLEIDGASNNRVDDVRELREVVRYVPTEGAYKIYIIDEVHMLSLGAFNALLKTLEEPPPHVVFIFATTEVQKVPETILSRCQRFNFRRIPVGQIAAHLRTIAQVEKIPAEEKALFLLASRAEGALRDAESLFDQVVSFAPEGVSVEAVQQVLGLVDSEVYFEVSAALAEAAPQRALEWVARVVDAGIEVEEFVYGLVEHFRRLFFVRMQGSAAGLEVAESERSRYEQAVAAFAVEDLLRILQSLLDLEGELRHSLQPRFRLELVLVRLALMGRAVELGQLLDRLKVIEQRLSGNGASAVAASPPPEAKGAGERILRTRTRSRPQEAPAPPAANSTGELEWSKVRQDWENLVQEVRRLQPSLGLFLQGAQLVGLENGVLRLGFASEDRFPMVQVLKNREWVEQICAQRWGCSLRLDCVIREQASARPAEEDSARIDPTVQSVLETFDGELL